MRICIDIDGTICPTKEPHENYEDVIPFKTAVETIQRLKREGHYIIFSTARHMKTCDSNLGSIISKYGNTLITWLDKHNIPHDEIWFQKPLADIYIDDKGLRMDDWDNVNKFLTEELL